MCRGGRVGNRPGANGGLSSPAGWALRSQNNFSAAATSPSHSGRHSHMPKALSLPLWMDWRGVKPLHQAADLRRKGDLPSQGARSQSSPPQERGGVCSQPVSLPLSRAHPAGTVWFRQDGGRSYLAQRCPDSHPGPPQTAFNISTGKFKVEAIFFAPIPEPRSGLWVDVKPSTTL